MSDFESNTLAACGIELATWILQAVNEIRAREKILQEHTQMINQTALVIKSMEERIDILEKRILVIEENETKRNEENSNENE